jgi:SAM-dependent methyltransferase
MNANAKPTFRDYVSDDTYMTLYNEYQNRYAARMRESDRVLIDLVRRVAAGRPADGNGVSVLDLGCSTGNLLLHLKANFQGLELFGGDVVKSAIEQCRSNPMLKGIQFNEMDIFELPLDRMYDIVVTNAVLWAFDDAQFPAALRNIGRLLTTDGTLLAFEQFHPFQQELSIVERSKYHPDGLTLYLRGYEVVRSAFAGAGFASVEFQPFNIPIDLPRPSDSSEINSYTVNTVDGARMSFRGALFQPWCHVVARKQ